MNAVASALESRSAEILAANAEDVREAKEQGVAAPLQNRLQLNAKKLETLAAGTRAIASLDEPIGRVLQHTTIADNLELRQVTSPLGVLLVIFESRPDALPQIAALALRSGNGVLLKGGKEAARSNAVLHRVITEALAGAGLPPELIALVQGREGVDELLELDDVIDLVIPRGSNALVTHIQSHTKIPVLGHADGVCHVYVDAAANLPKACRIAVDSKVDYPAACNAMETLLVHESHLAGGGAEKLTGALRSAGVTLYGGPRAAAALGLAPAPEGFHCEYGSLAATVELVPSLAAAVAHIHAHGSSHTEAIVTEDAGAAKTFLESVDSACVFHNASTRFADGFRFGLGAEVGVSTSRIHARGPVGVMGLLTTRWLLQGEGQVVRKDHGVTYRHDKHKVEPPPKGATLKIAAAALVAFAAGTLVGKSKR